MYNLTREEASEKLGVSVRSIDRYVKSWKLRSEKEWKVVMIHSWDVEAISWWTRNQNQEIINPQKEKPKYSQSSDSKELITQKEAEKAKEEVKFIYKDLKNEIKEKDKQISELTFKIWKMEEVVKNSISLVDFKKSQFLLEESKISAKKELENTIKEKEVLKAKYKDEKNANWILIVSLFIAVVLLVVVWFSKI